MIAYIMTYCYALAVCCLWCAGKTNFKKLSNYREFQNICDFGIDLTPSCSLFLMLRVLPTHWVYIY